MVLFLVRSTRLQDASELAQSEGFTMLLMARFQPSAPSHFRLLFQHLTCDAFAYLPQLLGACHLYVTGSKRKCNALPPPPHWRFRSPVPNLPIFIYCDDSAEQVSELEPFWLRAVVDFMDYKARLLTFLGAYTSTLGGGYFLCKHVSVAWRLALRQEKIALALEDYTSAGQCRVHLTYILMQMGKLKEAKRRLKREHVYATTMLHSERLEAIVRAASLYLAKLELEKDELAKPGPSWINVGGHKGNFVVDNYRRQRFVKV